MNVFSFPGLMNRPPRPSRQSRRGAARAPRRQFSPGSLALALLEERVVLSPTTFTVTTTADAGVGSLRSQIINANNNPGDDTIVFSLPAGSVINLTSGPLVIQPTTQDDSLIIDAGNNPVTINALNNTANSAPPVNQGIFQILPPSGDVKLGSLIMENALKPLNAGSTGGAVQDTAAGTLWLSKDSFLGNRADVGGGVYFQPAVAGSGSLVVDQDQFGQLVGGTPDASASNQATIAGGAIYFNNGAVGTTTGSLQVSNSQFYGSVANNLGAPGFSTAQGGAIYDKDTGGVQGMSILSSTFNGNRAIGQNGGAGQGGAIYTFNPTPANNTIDGTTFINNNAIGGGSTGAVAGGAAAGGAVYDGGLATTYSNDSFGFQNQNNGNTAVGGSATGTNGPGGTAQGGAIFTTPKNSLAISNGTTFYGNQASGGGGGGGGAGQGGAIYANASNPATFNGFYFSNSATGGAGGGTGGAGGFGQGGAIYNAGQLSLELAGFFGNAATGGVGGTNGFGGDAEGGAVWSGNSGLSISASTILSSVQIGGAGGTATAGNRGGGGGNALGAVYLGGNNPLSVANTQFQGNLNIGGAGGNNASTTGGGGDGGFAEAAAIHGPTYLSSVSTSFTNNVSIGGAGGSGAGAGPGNGGGDGGLVVGAVTVFIGGHITLTGVPGTTTFSGNVVTGGAGGDASAVNGIGGSGGTAFGAAIGFEGDYALISRASFSNNQTNGGAGGASSNASATNGTGGAGGAASGGAVDDNFGPMDLSTDTFTGNIVKGGKGGGIGGFTGNLGGGGNAYGGAVSADSIAGPSSSTVVASSNTMTNNSATGGAAGASAANPNLLGTAGTGFGGAIYNDGTAAVNTSTLTGNSATGGGGGFGGGAYNDTGTFTISFSTVTGNTATTSGADLFNNSGTAKRHFTTVGTAVNWPGTF